MNITQKIIKKSSKVLEWIYEGYATTSNTRYKVDTFMQSICNCCGSCLYDVFQNDHTVGEVTESLKAVFNLPYRYHKGIFVTTLDISEIVKTTPELQVGVWETIQTSNGPITVNLLNEWPKGVTVDRLPDNHPDLNVNDKTPIYRKAFGKGEYGVYRNP